ncbi:zeta toxin family protein [Streptomyces sp. NPDC054933]
MLPAGLSDDEYDDVLNQLILPTWTNGAVRQERPVVVVVAGQPGSGKTAVADLVHAVLNRRGGAVRICSDLYKVAHRRYARLLATDVRTAGVGVRPDVRRWQAAVEAHVRAHRLDAVAETALADADEFRDSSRAYRQAGTRIEVVAVATPEALSQLGLLNRFLAEWRYVSWENHDVCATKMLEVLAVIEAEQLADRVTVVRRDGTVLYDNELVGGAWQRRPAADKAVALERSRWWTARETAWFRRDLARTDQRLHREVLCEDRRLAVQRDAERAAAWAEPVRRIAQPTQEPPGVDYHRLTIAEHQWTFDELIAPSSLSGIVRRADPMAVYLLGLPEASKSTAGLAVKREMRAGTTHLVGEAFRRPHPDYFQLLEENPRSAGAAIRADYRAWFSKAEALVRTGRGDVLIEAAPDSAQEFIDSVLPFHQDGYPIELVVVAVREADSHLGSALRYARAQQLGAPAPFTSRTGHGVYFRTVADIVELAQSHPAIAAVTVIRRDGQAMLRQERAAGTARRASWALAAERLRPYTEQEAAQFLALHRDLRKALPQYRAELDETAALARPLMPARMQPVPIDQPRPPVWPLPVPLRPRWPGYEFFNSFNRAA